MPDSKPPDLATPAVPQLRSPREQVFPTLTPGQIARIAALGHVRTVAAGEVLVEAGTSALPFFVVKTGQIEIIRPSNIGDTLVTVHDPGGFTGEVSVLSGRRGLVGSRHSAGTLRIKEFLTRNGHPYQ